MELEQLQRHIESGKPAVLIQLRSRYVVNTVPALRYDGVELLDPDFAGVVHFARRAGTEAARKHHKYQGLEGLSVTVVKRAVYEDVVCRRRQGYLPLCSLLTALAAVLASFSVIDPCFEAGLTTYWPVMLLLPTTIVL